MKYGETDRRLYFSPFGIDEPVSLHKVELVDAFDLDELSAALALQVATLRYRRATMRYRKAVRQTRSHQRSIARNRARLKQNEIIKRARKQGRKKLTQYEHYAIEALNQQISDLS